MDTKKTEDWQPPISSDRFDSLIQELGIDIETERFPRIVGIMERHRIDDSLIDGSANYNMLLKD